MKKIPLFYLFLIIAAVFCFSLQCARDSGSGSKSIFQKHQYIGHAFGEIDGKAHTNSHEAFIENYKRGRRVFEVDFSLTSDGGIVCAHDSRDTGKLTHNEFKNQKLMGKYTTLDMHDVIGLLEKYKDIYIVTDSKENFILILSFIQEANRKNPELLKRIIPQIYFESDYYDLENRFHFNEIIYTLYKNAASYEQVMKFVSDKPNITVITMPVTKFNKLSSGKVASLKKLVFVHTLNDEKTIGEFRKKGANGFYTDSFFP